MNRQCSAQSKGSPVTDIVERTELILPGPAEALGALLGVPVPDLEGGEGLPLLWHWVYNLERPAEADLGADGHPIRGAVPAPPEPGRRRMWAGGRVRSLGPLRCGEPATRRTRVLSTEDKEGRGGRLTFVTVGHEIIQAGRLVVEEREDIVYRDPGAPAPAAGPESAAVQPPADDEWSIEVTPTLLFRFSALTYNAHRIHYDRDYAREVEGYPGLLTHGPLQALAMAEAARARGTATVDGLTFDYRIVSPLFDHQGLIVRAAPHEGRVRATVRDVTGRETAHATLTTARAAAIPKTPARARREPAHEQPNPELRAKVRELCSRFPDQYWRRLDAAREYPQDFVDALTQSGLLSALIPAKLGGLGLGLTSASIILEEINRSGGHSAACHAQMYTMGAVLRHGSEAQKRAYLPGIASGEIRLQAFSITEKEAGSDTTSIATTARRERDEYVIDGHKSWTSRIMQSDLLLLLARTAPRAEHAARAEGLSLFLVDLREVREQQPEALEVTPVRTMFNYATYEVRYRGLRIPASGLIGEEGHGFRHVIDGWNAERILLAAESIGDGYWFTERATSYASTRRVFGRPIGANQGVQFPIANAYMQLRAADLMRYRAAALFDAGRPCGAEANMAKLLSSEASWAAANACLDTHGGYGFVDAYDVERKFRETRLYKVAPVNNNLVTSFVATKVLGLPRSY
jgi:acyl-CoA dehydrogenase